MSMKVPTFHQWTSVDVTPDKHTRLRRILKEYDIPLELVEEYVREKKLERISGIIKQKGDR